MTGSILSEILMGIVNGTEWIVIIAVVAVLIFGAKKIPELARSLGKASSEYQKAKVEAIKEIERIKNMGLTTANDSEKLREVATTLGIDHTGKTDSELRALIQSKINER
jgi:sec-independent protein translocase protein TatA